MNEPKPAMVRRDLEPYGHTAKCISLPDGANPGSHVTVWAIQPTGLRDALRVARGTYDARIWIQEERVDA